MFVTLGMAAQVEEVKSHVTDAETGEALPFVHVIASNNNHTMTNANGDFTIKVDKGTILKLSYVGFETLEISSDKVGRNTKMKPMAIAIKEVKVRAWNRILADASSKLNKEYAKKKKLTSQYFFRMTTSYKKKELVEAFVSAKSEGSLRDIEFIKGKREQLSTDGITHPLISSMNFHHPLEIGPLIRDSKFWKNVVTPMTYNSQLNDLMKVYVGYAHTYYDISGDELTGNDGKHVYRISIRKKDDNTERSIITGQLYLDAESLLPLRFDGKVENMYLDITRDFYVETSPIEMEFKISYTHENGYSEISSMSSTVKNGKMSSSSILFNVDDIDLETGYSSDKDGSKASSKKKKKSTVKGTKAMENMLASIDDAGFDEMLWTHSNIVQRTDEEERLVSGDSIVNETDSNDVDNRSPLLRKVPQKFYDLVDHIERFGRSLPQEKVYIHMDNTCYYAGDTIWFSAYSRQTCNGKPSQISGVLYVELLNHEGYLVERKLVEMFSGRGCGNFVLDKESYGGYYELRAYTRWQLNWGLHEHKRATISDEWFMTKEQQWNFYRDYDKLYSRVFPVYDAPSHKGEYGDNMTYRTMRRKYKHDPHDSKIIVSLFPEGGNLVEGLPCRVAFEAAWDDGKEVEGTLSVKGGKTVNQQDKILARTERRGRGSFVLVPGKDNARKLVFTTKDGQEVDVTMPDIQKEGVAMSVDIKGDSVYLNINTSAGLDTANLALTIMHEGVLKAFHEITQHRQGLATSLTDLQAGVNQVTVFDTDGRVYADRLFFVRANEMALHDISISGQKDEYVPYEKVTLDIQAPDSSGTLSVAVRDVNHMNDLYDNASIMTEMLLTSEIKGFVENPEWYFTKDDAEHNRALDLLMMTQGWRRFNWQEMAIKNAWQLTQPAERTPIITGKVYDIMEGYFTEETRQALEMAEADNLLAATDENGTEDSPPAANNPYLSRFSRDWDKYTEKHWSNNLIGLLTNSVASPRDLAEVEYFPGDKNVFKNKHVRVHAELVNGSGTTFGVMDLDTKDGSFKFQLPRYYGDWIFFLSAADTTKWKGRKYTWIQTVSDDESLLPDGHKRRFRVLPADFSVRVNFPYPRFVKPYSFYQEHTDYSRKPEYASTLNPDGSIQIDEVDIWAKHSTLSKLQDTIPTLTVDAYQAYNEALDAGFLEGNWWYMARNYVADYGMDKPYVTDPYGEIDYKFKMRYGYDQLSRALGDITSDRDSAYMRSNLRSFTTLHSNYTDKWTLHSYIDKYVLYTDYQPRLEGNERYLGSNLPNTEVAVYPFPDDSRRHFYRDRRYILPGFAYMDSYYSPDYSKRKLGDAPEDYRRTLYWNPYLTLDKNGKASVTFYNNGSRHAISVDAQGMSNSGDSWKNR